MLVGYKVIEHLQRNAGADVVRCLETQSGKHVIIKQHPIGTREAAQLRHEHAILALLAERNVPNVLRPHALVEDQGIVALVLEDVGAEAVLSRNRVELTRREALNIALNIAQALAGVHAAGVIHKDIKPDNIVYNRQTQRVQLIDFGIAVRVAREFQAVDSLHRLEGTIGYVSPEQTGRTNRLIDHRSDFYSLGVVLYEMMTGVLPLIGDSIVQQVHAILSRSPARPRNVPEPIVDIMFKLMEKDPEKRYQSAEGLAHDLQKCLDGLQDDGSIAPFPLAQQDLNKRFEIPQGLFGRELDVGALLSAYQRVSDGRREVVAFAGASGVGKTAVVNELRAALLQNNGMFAAGKYDQLNRHVPLSGLGQALDVVVRKILREPDASLQLWRDRLQMAVGRLGRVLIDVVPAAALLLGPQEPTYALPPQESENRLFMVLTRFLSAVYAEQPLALFLDDLQWADGGTHKFLRQLASMSQQGSGLLLIVAYRDNEVPAGHPLVTTFEEMRSTGTKVSVRTLAPLTREDAISMLAAAAQLTRGEVSPLASLIFEKTGGNAFFIHELTRNLVERGLISYRESSRSWSWDIEAVRRLQVTDSVVELMREKLRTLAPETQRVLGIAACLGVDFTFRRLRFMVPQDALIKELQAAVQSGLVLPTDGGHRLLGHLDEDAQYRFVHDRVHQACYEALGDERAKTHHTMGERFLDAARKSSEKSEAWVFQVVNHLNLGISCIDAAHREDVARLNLLAGTQSRRAAAYDVAHGYLRNALEMLGGLDADKVGDLWRNVSLALADCEAILGRIQDALARTDEVLAKSRTDIEAGQAQVRRVILLQRMGQGAQAVAAGTEGLKRLGFELRADARGVTLERVRIRWLLRGRKLSALAALPETQDLRARTMCQLLAAISPPMIFMGNGPGYGATSLGQVRLAAEHGAHTEVLVGFGGAVLDAASRRMDYKAAREHSQVARAMVERFEGSAGRTQALMLSYTCYEYLNVSPTRMLAMCDEGLQLALEAGDPIATVTFRQVQSAIAFQVSLGLCQERFDTHERALVASRDRVRLSFATAPVLAIRGLQGATDVGLAALEEDVKKAREGKFTPAITLVRQMMLCYYARDIERGLGYARQIAKLNFFRSFLDFEITMAAFYVCMLLIEHARATKRPVGEGEDAALWTFASQKIRAVGSASPKHYVGLVSVLDAELAALRDDEAIAAHHYEIADEQLESGGLLSFRCVALECAGRFFAAHKRRALALGYLAQARDSYETWGAISKTAALEREFPEFLTTPANHASTTSMDKRRSTSRGGTSSVRSSGTTDSSDIDVPALMTAAQALASDRDTATLLPKILRSVREVGGATKAVLLVVRGDKRDLITESGASEETPESVIQYVERTRERLVINDVKDSDFAADRYVKAHPPQSILCAPLVHGDQLKGVIYLENNVATQAFSEDRLLSVSMLASQAAIAVENARLYASLEDTVAERTAALRQAHDRLVTAERTDTETRMAGGFAHEIRNALAGPAYVLDAALKGQVPVGEMHDNVRDVLETAHGGIRKGLELVERILWYAQMQRLPNAVESTVLSQSVDKVLKQLSEKLDEQTIACHVGVAPDTRVAVQPEHVEAILSALVSNAVDALSLVPNDAERRIEVRTSLLDTGDAVELRIEDNGAGMEENVQGRVFQPFFSTKGVGGQGLSLGVSKKLVAMYGGELTFTSTPAKGSTFVVRFPVKSTTEGS